jgi:hypothetical protein
MEKFTDVNLRADLVRLEKHLRDMAEVELEVEEVLAAVARMTPAEQETYLRAEGIDPDAIERYVNATPAAPGPVVEATRPAVPGPAVLERVLGDVACLIREMLTIPFEPAAALSGLGDKVEGRADRRGCRRPIDELFPAAVREEHLPWARGDLRIVCVDSGDDRGFRFSASIGIEPSVPASTALHIVLSDSAGRKEAWLTASSPTAALRGEKLNAAWGDLRLGLSIRPLT